MAPLPGTVDDIFQEVTGFQAVDVGENAWEMVSRWTNRRSSSWSSVASWIMSASTGWIQQHRRIKQVTRRDCIIDRISWEHRCKSWHTFWIRDLQLLPGLPLVYRSTRVEARNVPNRRTLARFSGSSEGEPGNTLTLRLITCTKQVTRLVRIDVMSTADE